MWTVPGATMRYVRNKSQGVRDRTLGLILHVQVGNGELTGWFNNPGSSASSAWQAMKDGRVFQFGDPDADKFWTQGAGNADYGAVETEGYPSEPLTEAQLDAVARIYAAGHLEEGWPFALANRPGERGLGTHAMGGAAWGNHPYCPGRLRTDQRPEIIARARALVEGHQDMPLTDTDVDRIVHEILTRPLGTADGKPYTVAQALRGIRSDARGARRDAGAALEVAEALAAKGAALSAAEVTAAAERGAAAALDERIAGVDVDLIVNPQETPQ